MICLECGKNLKNVTNTHLKKCCGLTNAEYKEKYPDAEFMDAHLKQRYGSPLDKNPNWKGGRTYKKCLDCGKGLSRHSTVKRCQKCASKYRDNFRGQKHTNETKKKMRESAAKRDPKTYNPGRADPKIISENSKKYWANKTQEEKLKILDKFIKAGYKHSRRASKTSIENKVAEMLDELNVKYDRNVFIKQYNVDFLISGNIILECFGDYWHCNPKFYSPEYFNKSIKMSAKDKWKKDADRKERIQKEGGYDFYIFWGHDIKNDSEKIKSELKSIVERDNLKC